MSTFKKGYLVLVHCLLLLVITKLSAQMKNTSPTTTHQLAQVSISSPTAAALGKYGDIPVSYHTGIPNISIPIYTIKTGSLQLPVNLNYHASGLKVQEQASWVGAGWSLDAGGVITRTVMGAPDDKGLNANTEKGYFSDYGFVNYLFSSGNATCSSNGPVYCPAGTSYPPQDAKIQNGALDGEPDLYFFNFNGHTGKFYFNDDRTPMLLPEQDLRITPIYPGSDVRGITGFIITTPDGVQYCFGKNQNSDGNIDAVEVTYNISTQASNNTNLGATSSWFLNKIVSADNQFVINLIYASEKSTYYTLSMFPIPAMKSPDLTASNLEYDLNKNFIDGVRLSKILFANGEVDFNTGNLRQDLIAGISYRGLDESTTANTDASYGAKVLDNITIQSTAGFCKKFSLGTSYFYDNSALTGDLFTKAFTNLNLQSDKYRLKLDSIKETSCDNTAKIPPYKFTYFSGTVPRKLSFGIDHWGFYNGVTNNTGLIPTYNVINAATGQPATTLGANRDAAFPAMRNGVLQQITYPTGGNTVFDFEGNSTYINNQQYQLNQKYYTALGYDGSVTPGTGYFNSNDINYQIDMLNTSIYDATLAIYNSSNVQIQYFVANAHTTPQYNYSLSPAGQYRIVISLASGGNPNPTGTGVQAKLSQWENTTISTSDALVGGLRIKTITQNDAVTSTPIVTSYGYNYDNDVTSNHHSSGILFSQPVYIQGLRNDPWGIVSGASCSSIGCFTCFGSSVAYYQSPSSLRPMSSTKGNHIGYAEVYVSQASNGYSVYKYYGKNGIITHKFDPLMNDVCVRQLSSFCSADIPGSPAAPLPYDPLAGELFYEAVYRQDGQMLKNTSYFPAYTFDSLITPGIISKFFITGNSPSTTGVTTFTEYNLQTARKTRDSSVTNTFDAATGNYLTTISGTDYYSKFHNEPTQTYSLNSRGETLISSIKNAFDYRISNYTTPDQLSNYYANIQSDENYLSSALAGLPVYPPSDLRYYYGRLNVYINYRYKKAVHRQQYIAFRRQNFTDPTNFYATNHSTAKSSANALLKPIFELQDAYQNPVIEQADWNNNKLLQASFNRYDYALSPAGNIVPAKVQLINLLIPTTTFSYAAVSGNTLVQDSRYKDESFYKFYNGHVAEVTNKNGLTTSYIFGYNNTLPIVKAVGIDYATLKAAYDAVSGNLSTIRNQPSLNKALVSTYAYTPLLGMTSETDVTGKAINYEYDLLGRLLNIKDYQGNIMKNFQYHYANNGSN